MKEYLGDSVYATYDGHNVILTTENGTVPSNIIILEPAVVKGLLNYIERVRDQKKINRE